MKTFTRLSFLRVTIGVALAGVFTILAYPFASIFIGKSLATPWYFGILFTLSSATIVLALLLFLAQAAEARKDTDKIQTHFDSLDSIEEYYSDLARRIKSQYQDSPVKVMMDINGTPITIESNDASKVEDLVKHLAQSMQVSNLAEAKASHLHVREDTETYRTESNSE